MKHAAVFDDFFVKTLTLIAFYRTFLYYY